MPVYDFLVQYIIPLFSSNPSAQALEFFEGMYWLFTSFNICYFACYLPYYFLRWVGKFPSLLRKRR